MAENRRFAQSEEFITSFIELFKKKKCLWMIKAKEYSNRVLKNKAYEELLALCKEYNDECDIDFVKKKIKSLRDSFRKEYKKVRATEKSGASTDDLYVPNLWYFDLLIFLKDQEVPRAGLENDAQVEVTETPTEKTYNNNDTENEGGTIETETNLTEKETASSTRPLKRKLPKTTATETRKNAVQKAYELINKPDDEYDIIGQSVSIKLRKMADRQKLYCEKVINEALYKGLLGELNVKSHVSNQASQNAGSRLLSETLTHDTSGSGSVVADYNNSYPRDNYSNPNDTSNQPGFCNLQQNIIYPNHETPRESQNFIQLQPRSGEGNTFLNINSSLERVASSSFKD